MKTEYLLQIRLKSGQVDNFIGDENQIGEYIRMLSTFGEMCIYKVIFGKVQTLKINFVNKTDGGYVSDMFGNLEFNF